MKIGDDEVIFSTGKKCYAGAALTERERFEQAWINEGGDQPCPSGPEVEAAVKDVCWAMWQAALAASPPHTADVHSVRAVAERTQAAPDDWTRVGGYPYVSKAAVLRALGGGEWIWDDEIDRAIRALSSTAPPQAQPKPASDHSKATQPIWSAMLGPCICKFCNALRAGEQAEAAPVEPDNETLLKLARRCLWIAFVWNDHNFKAAHTYAKREAEECGIDSFDAANVWIAQAPKPEQPTSAAASDQQVDAITSDIDSGFRQEEHVAMLRAVFRAGAAAKRAEGANTRGASNV